jgi:hypothetical protein
MATEGCIWTVDKEGVWETGCDNAFFFDSGGVADNKFNFCPYCGKPLKAEEAHGN